MPGPDIRWRPDRPTRETRLHRPRSPVDLSLSAGRRGQSLDRLFERVFADRTDEERAAIKKKFATERAIARAPKRVEAICLDLIEHLEGSIRPNGFKAQLVASSREAAVLYKETLDRLHAPASALIMSAQHNEQAHLAKWRLHKPQKDKIIKSSGHGYIVPYTCARAGLAVKQCFP